jgi:hypothetical protein
MSKELKEQASEILSNRPNEWSINSNEGLCAGNLRLVYFLHEQNENS